MTSEIASDTASAAAPELGQPTNPSTKLWRVPGYKTWFVSDTSRELSDSLVTFAVPLIALVITNSPAQAGIIAAVGAAFGVVLTLVGGVLADRHRRTTLMLAGGSIGVIIGLAFTLIDANDAWTFALLLITNVLIRSRKGIFDPSAEALLKDIVPSDAMGSAQAANQGRGAVLQLAGGPFGGLLLGVGGWLIGLAVMLFQAVATAAALLLNKRVPPKPKTDAATHANFLGEMREGFTWIFSRRDLRGVLWAATIINLGFGAAMTTIVYSLQQAGFKPFEIGLITAVSGASMLIGAILAPFLLKRVPGSVLIIGGFVVATVGTLVITQVHAFGGILMVLAGTVLLVPPLNSALLGYFMVVVPTEIMGRANAAVGTLAMLAVPLAPMVAGLGLSWAGRTPTLIFCSALCIIAALITIANRALRSLPIESRWEDHAKQFTPPQ